MAPTEIEPGVVPAQWWTPAGDGRLRCDLCPRGCTLQDGQRGFCFVRERRDDQLVLTSYGRASGFCVDPIEKKPLNHFLPGTSVLSFGTAGCNLGCRFCQNWDISKARQDHRLTDRALPEAIAAAAIRCEARSVAFTYNDPVIFAEFAIDTAKACREHGIATVAVTAGYIGEGARAPFFEHVDAANVDLKAFSERFYRKLCFAELEPVKQTLAWLKRETQVWLEVTTLLIPGENDSESEIDALCGWFVETLGPDTPLHFTAFHPDFKLMERGRTPVDTVQRARRQALRHGLRHVYTGNVHDPEGQSTYCGGCGELVIERDWYAIGAWRLDRDGSCGRCGQRLAGHFDGPPGTWGRQRLRVTM
ncbi:MAG: AmmeMemoRadiSam system radical SAM enzyme [Deltaproteobacteria bacterium]|nr:AmmeMemoRadiSam system radical SAM enzyme [Deltaproteobacteria bacterium]